MHILARKEREDKRQITHGKSRTTKKKKIEKEDKASENWQSHFGCNLFILFCFSMSFICWKIKKKKRWETSSSQSHILSHYFSSISQFSLHFKVFCCCCSFIWFNVSLFFESLSLFESFRPMYGDSLIINVII